MTREIRQTATHIRFGAAAALAAAALMIAAFQPDSAPIADAGDVLQYAAASHHTD
ncbi:hypothetical protein [Hyphococcus sp.]|jgi:hypothetical protein|uniref:hypothetical protein n=1 Tax=Hyphococcus sp. TaxID=2038636 RepID=UPI003D0BC7F1